MNSLSGNQIYVLFNAIGVVTAYVMLAMSVHLAPVDLSTKGYWGMGIFLLTCALVNLIKFRLDERAQQERLYKLEAAKNEKIISDYITE
jgi:hypothetical protein